MKECLQALAVPLSHHLLCHCSLIVFILFCGFLSISLPVNQAPECFHLPVTVWSFLHEQINNHSAHCVRQLLVESLRWNGRPKSRYFLNPVQQCCECNAESLLKNVTVSGLCSNLRLALINPIIYQDCIPNTTHIQGTGPQGLSLPSSVW